MAVATRSEQGQRLAGFPYAEQSPDALINYSRDLSTRDILRRHLLSLETHLRLIDQPPSCQSSSRPGLKSSLLHNGCEPQI